MTIAQAFLRELAGRLCRRSGSGLAEASETGHDVGVTLWLVVLIGVLLWFAASARASEARRSTGKPGERRGIAPGWWLVAAVAGVLLVRFGLHWVAVAGGAVLAVARGVAPLVRLLPFFMRARGSMGPDARGSADARPGGEPRTSGEPRMTREEALQVLGLTSSATAEDVTREYRRLMKKIHPDLGGSSYLAAKINEAREVLSRAL